VRWGNIPRHYLFEKYSTESVKVTPTDYLGVTFFEENLPGKNIQSRTGE
jgi:hypothetical protein